MRKAMIFAVVIFLFTAILSVDNTQAQSSDEVPRIEVGGQYSLLKSGGPIVHGVNGLVVYNFNKYISADNSISFYPTNTGVSSQLVTGFFGAKLGIRADRFGVFVKAKPGFFHLSDSAITVFGADLGGVLEIYQTKRLGYRFDVGNIIYRTPSGPITLLQVGAGVMLRF